MIISNEVKFYYHVIDKASHYICHAAGVITACLRNVRACVAYAQTMLCPLTHPAMSLYGAEVVNFHCRYPKLLAYE